MKKLLILIIVATASLSASATSCSNPHVEFIVNMQHNGETIVSNFLEEKYDIAQSSINKVTYKHTKNKKRIRDYAVYGLSNALDFAVSDPCGAHQEVGGAAGKGSFQVEYFGQNGEECRATILVKGSVSFFAQNYKVKLKSNSEMFQCN